MYQIGIVARPGRDLTCLRAELSRHSLFKLETFTTAPNAVSILKSGNLNAMIVLVEEFNQKQLSLVTKIREFHPGLPLVFATQFPKPELQSQVLKCKQSILLNTFEDINDFAGVTLRLIRGQKAYNRTHKRQRALQTASIESDDRLAHGCLLDLAGGGARLRAFKNQYKKGDQFNLKVPLSYLKKTYKVRAEVVWSQNEPVTPTHPTFSQLMGLKFISVLG